MNPPGHKTLDPWSDMSTGLEGKPISGKEKMAMVLGHDNQIGGDGVMSESKSLFPVGSLWRMRSTNIDGNWRPPVYKVLGHELVEGNPCVSLLRGGSTRMRRLEPLDELRVYWETADGAPMIQEPSGWCEQYRTQVDVPRSAGLAAPLRSIRLDIAFGTERAIASKCWWPFLVEDLPIVIRVKRERELDYPHCLMNAADALGDERAAHEETKCALAAAMVRVGKLERELRLAKGGRR